MGEWGIAGHAEKSAADRDTGASADDEIVALFDTGKPAAAHVVAALSDDSTAPKSARVPARVARGFRNRFWRDLCIGAFLVIVTHIFLVQVSVVRGLSMSPSLNDGDRLMVDRISYAMTDVSRFDVVVLRYPKNPRVDFVKRVVGLPGDSVELCCGVLRVNGEILPEEFAHVSDTNAAGTWIVPEGSFFVLGDNRPISCDSREFGMVNQELLKGKVRVIFWPLDHFSLL